MVKTKAKNSSFILHSSYLKGFTLIELLVTVVVLGLIMTAVTGIFLTTIKTSKKADAIAEVKENGDYALGLMERKLRNAEEIISCGNSIKYRLPDDDLSVERSFQLGGDEGDQIYSSETGGVLTSRDLKVTSLSFSCNPSPPDPVNTVSIVFTLTKGERSDVREFATVSFTGMVKVRKY